jgi:pyruvate,water dikinase
MLVMRPHRLKFAGHNTVRDEIGLTDARLMVPFCRTAEESRKVLDVTAAAGLVRGENGLEV